MHNKAITAGYDRWLANPNIDEATRRELQSIATDEAEIKDRFHTHLTFGTGGLRGIIGAGTNRMNIYTVRRATQGLAAYILSLDGTAAKGVAIAYDCRRMSAEFCEEAALTLSANGIRAYVFDSLRPTPLLSFAVRHLGCTAGIVITASHNPPEYNGYKVYWDDGGQVPPARAEMILAEINKIDDFSQVKSISKSDAEKAGLYHTAGPEVDEAYMQAVLSQRLNPGMADAPLKIVFTPLHGAGNIPISTVLSSAGYKDVYVVKEQAGPDGNFPTVDYPNPEDHAAFALAEKLAAKVQGDLIICTDPDADRLGVAVRDSGGIYRYLSGNMTGALLAEYLLSQKQAHGTLPANAAIVTTIVSTNMAQSIAGFYNAACFEVLTGFKYIGEKIKEFETNGTHTYIFGFEESYGYLAGDYTRDKDAVAAALLICETAAFYQKQNMSLWDAMLVLFKKYGYFKETLESVTLKGIKGLAQIRHIMDNMRANPPQEINGIPVTERRDYNARTIVDCMTGTAKAAALPQSDVLYYTLADGSWFCIRPSGTEPKIKLYFGTSVSTWDNISQANAQAEQKLSAMSRLLKERIL